MKRILAGSVRWHLACRGCQAAVGVNVGGWLVAEVKLECFDEDGEDSVTHGEKVYVCDRCVVEMAAESAAQVRVLRGDSAEVRR